MISLPLNENLTLYLLEEEAILFSLRSSQLYGLDRTATTILLRLAEGDSQESLKVELGSCPDATKIMAQLTALLAGDEAQPGSYLADLVCPEMVHSGRSDLQYYQLLNSRFFLQGPESLLLQWVIPYLSHLRINKPATAELDVTIRQERACYSLCMNGTFQGRNLLAEQVLPLLHDRLRKFAYQNHNYLLAIHAAVVSKADRVFVFPGMSGSGKSTLAAALLSRGYRLFSDEIALVDSATTNILPLPLALGLKSGSWPVVFPCYPDLLQLPVFVRLDDSEVRYLLPADRFMAKNDECDKATQIIFPSFNKGLNPKIDSLSPFSALRVLTQGGYQVNGLDSDKLEKILSWICDLKCYSMVYSSTDEAFALLESIE